MALTPNVTELPKFEVANANDLLTVSRNIAGGKVRAPQETTLLGTNMYDYARVRVSAIGTDEKTRAEILKYGLYSPGHAIEQAARYIATYAQNPKATANVVEAARNIVRLVTEPSYMHLSNSLHRNIELVALEEISPDWKTSPDGSKFSAALENYAERRVSGNPVDDTDVELLDTALSMMAKSETLVDKAARRPNAKILILINLGLLKTSTAGSIGKIMGSSHDNTVNLQLARGLFRFSSQTELDIKHGLLNDGWAVIDQPVIPETLRNPALSFEH